MKKYILILLLISFACSSQNQRVIDKDTMRDVLVDLHLSDAILQINSVRNRSVQVKESHYDSVISSHGVSKEDFEWNLAYYSYTSELDKIMGGVIDTLSSMEGDLQKEMIHTKVQKHGTRNNK